MVEDMPDGVLEMVLMACEADADAANLSASCTPLRRVSNAVLDVRRVLRRAKARGSRYTEMLRLSAEYEAIPESYRMEDFSPSGSMSWHRIDSRCSDSSSGTPIEHGQQFLEWSKAQQIARKWFDSWAPIEHGQHFLEWSKAQQIARKWFDLLVVGDFLSPGGVVKEKSAHGINQGVLDGEGHICYVYPTSRVLVPPRTDTVLL